ncbi:MAG: C25 family cysteine peptidase, partial [Candidatus Hermodarchaeota archaeon]
MIHWSSKNITFIVIISVFIIPTAYNVFNCNNLGTVIDKSVRNLPSSSTIPEIDINSELPTINYQELNDLWYNQKVEMLIVINDSSYLDAVTPLVEWKNYKGVKTIVLYNYSNYEGRDKAEKIRNMIKSYYESDNLKWVLLAGDAEENLIPIREVFNPDTAEIEGESEYSNWDEYYKPTDFYYADLTGSWDDNNNGKFGESATKSGNNDEISWIPEVYVGRLPADNPSELSFMINKSLDYEKAVYAGTWMNRMLLAGGISSYSPPEDEARLTEYIWQNYTLSAMNFTHLTKTTSFFTPTTPPLPNVLADLTPANFKNELDKFAADPLFKGICYSGRAIEDVEKGGFLSDMEYLASKDLQLDLVRAC